MGIGAYGNPVGALLLTTGFLYYVLVSCCICEGKGKNAVYILLAFFLQEIGWYAGWLPLGVLGVLVESAVFLLFYSDDRKTCKRAILPGIVLLLLSAGVWSLGSDGYLDVIVAVILYSTLLFVLLSAQRGYFKISRLVLVLLMNGLLAGADMLLTKMTAERNLPRLEAWSAHLFLLCLSVLLFLILEVALRGYEAGYQKRSRDLQEEMLQRQFGEIRDIYLNMRGWRHDYHNHIQVLKTEGHFGDIKENEDFRRFHYRSGEKVYKEFMLHAIGRNLMKYHRFLHHEIEKYEGKKEQKAA